VSSCSAPQLPNVLEEGSGVEEGEDNLNNVRISQRLSFGIISRDSPVDNSQGSLRSSNRCTLTEYHHHQLNWLMVGPEMLLPAVAP